MDEGRRESLKLGLMGGLISGIVLFFALHAITGNIYTALFIPVAGALGGIQAYLMPRRD